MVRWWNHDCTMMKKRCYIQFSPSYYRAIAISPSYHREFIIVPSCFYNCTIVPSRFHHRTNVHRGYILNKMSRLYKRNTVNKVYIIMVFYLQFHLHEIIQPVFAFNWIFIAYNLVAVLMIVGAIALLVRPMTVVPEVPGSILGNTAWIFQRYFQCFPPT
jgi:hypothetical protein